MSRQKVKFEQVGTFAVGNRLLDPGQRTVQADRARSNAQALQCGTRLGVRGVPAKPSSALGHSCVSAPTRARPPSGCG